MLNKNDFFMSFLFYFENQVTNLTKKDKFFIKEIFSIIYDEESNQGIITKFINTIIYLNEKCYNLNYSEENTLILTKNKEKYIELKNYPFIDVLKENNSLKQKILMSYEKNNFNILPIIIDVEDIDADVVSEINKFNIFLFEFNQKNFFQEINKIKNTFKVFSSIKEYVEYGRKNRLISEITEKTEIVFKSGARKFEVINKLKLLSFDNDGFFTGVKKIFEKNNSKNILNLAFEMLMFKDLNIKKTLMWFVNDFVKDITVNKEGFFIEKENSITLNNKLRKIYNLVNYELYEKKITSENIKNYIKTFKDLSKYIFSLEENKKINELKNIMYLVEENRWPQNINILDEEKKKSFFEENTPYLFLSLLKETGLMLEIQKNIHVFESIYTSILNKSIPDSERIIALIKYEVESESKKNEKKSIDKKIVLILDAINNPFPESLQKAVKKLPLLITEESTYKVKGNKRYFFTLDYSEDYIQLIKEEIYMDLFYEIYKESYMKIVNEVPDSNFFLNSLKEKILRSKILEKNNHEKRKKI